jgi:hypothetical protein
MVDVSLQGDDYPLTDDENAYPERPACLCTLSVRGVSFVGDDVWGLKKGSLAFCLGFPPSLVSLTRLFSNATGKVG